MLVLLACQGTNQNMLSLPHLIILVEVLSLRLGLIEYSIVAQFELTIITIKTQI